MMWKIILHAHYIVADGGSLCVAIGNVHMRDSTFFLEFLSNNIKERLIDVMSAGIGSNCSSCNAIEFIF